MQGTQGMSTSSPWRVAAAMLIAMGTLSHAHTLPRASAAPCARPRAARLLPTQRHVAVSSDTDAPGGGGADGGGEELHCVCSRCGAVYVANMAQFGGKGARVRCSVCTNTWFQMTERLVAKPPAFELQPFPEERRADRPAALDSPQLGGKINMYVGNMPFSLTDVALAQMFSEYGRVTKAMLMRDEIGRSKGFGFVEMADEAEGQRAMAELNDQVFEGRPITVSAREVRGPPPRRH